ncbi:protein FAM167A-like [Saccostrea echinata]|uniref:protein FAM167A-like n=1 Tax=Saccostrea echinata TaxID=191078 RepID=UPI002A7FDFAC|nr:protein FAM167A-like [Saccostrea echinata]XP_061189996.1 protein FAM167A-like [Saccostrea echinata]
MSLHVPSEGRHEHSPTMKEYRRPSLSVIDETNNNEEENFLVLPSITVTNCEDSLQASDDNDEVSSVTSSRSGSETDLAHLKVTANRLRLATRRSSIVEWKERYLEKPRRRSKPDLKVDFDQNGNDVLTEDRKHRINEALIWIKEELQAMRSQDQALARKLLSLRQDIHQLKLNRSCQEHREMLDDVTKDMEEMQQLKDISDLHVDTVENPLKHLGVTSYNLTARRFSTC